MKKHGFVMVLALLTFCFAFTSTSKAGEWDAFYPNIPNYYGDDSTVYDRFSWDGWNHLAVTWNNTVETASAIQMDPNGVPNIYYWGDIYDNVYPVKMYLYYSYNGYTWYYAGVYYYY